MEKELKEYQEALEGWKQAVFNTITTAEKTREFLDLATGNLSLFFKDLKRFEKRMNEIRNQ